MGSTQRDLFLPLRVRSAPVCFTFKDIEFFEEAYEPLNRFEPRPAARSAVDPDSEPTEKRVYPRMGGFRSDPGWWPGCPPSGQ